MESKSNGGTTAGDASILLLTGGAGNVTLSDGTVDGCILHVIRQAGAGDLALNPNSFTQGATGVKFKAYDAANFVWDGSNWYCMGPWYDSIQGKGVTLY